MRGLESALGAVVLLVLTVLVFQLRRYQRSLVRYTEARVAHRRAVPITARLPEPRTVTELPVSQLVQREEQE